MTTPTFCTECGHELGIGRFCTNCGRPVPGRHPEAAPAASAPARSAPVVPPSADQVPPSARYPLFADAPPTVMSPAVGSPQPPPPPPSSSYAVAQPPAARSWMPWVVALVVLALVAALGAFLLLGGDDGEQAADETRDDQSQDAAPSSPGRSDDDDPEEPDSTGSGAPVDAPDPEDVVDLTSEVTAEVPSIARPSRDRQGKVVKFVAANMWDGKPRTAWRMAGDGTGESLTFDLGEEVVITDVGMINGYAKVDGPINWYRSNRRVRAVQWEFDDGTRITQELGDEQTMQMAAIGPLTTRTITMHLLTVTEPGKGADGRDFTAISEVRFLGATAD